MSTKNSTITASPQIVVVEASAGSGKTYALAKRYVDLLVGSSPKPGEIPLKDILAVTFTNKAAHEMKDRILLFLKRIALDRFPNKEAKEDILSSLGIKGDLASKKATEALDYIIRNYSFLQIRTIDSFINSLLKGCAFKFALSSRFAIQDEPRDYIEYSLDKLIDRTGTDKKVASALDSFLRQYTLIENKTGWFARQDIYYLINSLFSIGNTYGGVFKKYDLRGGNLLKKKKEILDLSERLRDNIPEGTNKRFLTSLMKFCDESKERFTIEKLSDYFNREEFPINKGYEVPGKVEKLWREIRETIRELCELESFSMFNCYIDIFNMVLGELREVAGKDEILFLQELNRQARVLFSEESVTVPEIYYRLATRIRHYLIDEFQDTSLLQWRNLYPMIEEALSTGGTLFYVGDKKQAIFRFRGGEASLFDEVASEFNISNVESDSLRKNFRSQKEIVDFNNEVFSGENLRRFIKDKEACDKDDAALSPQDMEKVLRVFHNSEQTGRKELTHGYVKVETVACEDKDERNEIVRPKLISLIKELKNRFSPRDIAILARENDDVELVTAWLLEEGIDVESDKTLNIRECPFIKELVSFLKFLNSPIDDLYFASFMLGSIFSKATGIEEAELRDFVFKLRYARRGESAVYLYKEFQTKYPEVWDQYINEFFKNVGFYPAYEFVVSIMGKFNILSNFPEYQGFFMRFLELIKEKEEDAPSISSFLEFFDKAREDDLFVNVTDSQAVKVLTIHKSKGLEFGVVILPFLTMELQVGSRAQSYIVHCEDNNIELVRMKKRYRNFSPRLNDIYLEEYRKSLIDELDNTYVAFTRAKNELYIFMPKKSSNRHNLASLLIPWENTERGTRRVYKDERPAAEAPKVIDLPPSKYEDWLHLLKDEFIAESQLKNRDRIQKGTVAHFMFSFIGNLHGKDKDALIKEAIAKTRTEFPFLDDLAIFEELVKRVLDDVALKDFFYIEKGLVFQEKEVVNSIGHTKRIDRLIVTDDEAWIIDYKSSKDEPAQYEEQISEYMTIVRDLYPNRKVKGFLLYLDDLSVDEVYE